MAYFRGMIFLAEIALIAVNILMAWWHAKLIERGKPIRHGYWGFVYLIFSGGLSIGLGSWVLMVASLFIRKVFFDLSLNLFREKPFFYVSANPKSIIDRVHNYLFGDNSEIYMSVYFLTIVIINIYLCSQI